MSLPRLRIKKRDQQRLRDGHLWVYSNEIDTDATPLKTIITSLVHLEDYRGQALGTASFNGKSLICARVLGTELFDVLDVNFFEQRIGHALTLRQAIYAQPFYRLIFGEGDYLPGLVIDRFNGTLVVQIATQAIEQAIEALTTALQNLLGADVKILFKNDGKGRHMEQLPEYIKSVGGEITDLEVIENGVPFTAPIDGQKTGWFYDHRDGRAWLNRCAKGKTVLDLFSYIGGWGVQAAFYGASDVTCVDISEHAGEMLLANAKQNKLDQVKFVEADVFEYLKQPIQQTYDVVVLDPPALIQKRKDFEQGRQAYFMLNEAAIQRVTNGGFLVTASCSLHLNRDELISIVQQVARRQKKSVQFIHESHPESDHPHLLAMVENDYLKCMMFRVTDLV